MIQVRFTDLVVGLVLDSGREMVFLVGETTDLSTREFGLLPRNTFEVVERRGVLDPLDLEGEVVRCDGECGGLWRRGPKLKNVRICAVCAMGNDDRKKAQRRHRLAIL